MTSVTSLTALSPIFTRAEAYRAGWSDRELHAAHNRGDIQRIARGIYALPNLRADLDLAEIAVRAPDATLCLTSALAHHDLTDEMPRSIDVALPRTRRPPRTRAPVTWHRFADETFGIGRTELAVTGQLFIGIYSPERAVIDAYRLRHLYGADQATEALKRWLAARGSQPAELLNMARRFPASAPAIHAALQTLL